MGFGGFKSIGGHSIPSGSGDMAWRFAFSPDSIRFTDFMPGLIKFDPFRVGNRSKGIGIHLAGRTVEAPNLGVL